MALKKSLCWDFPSGPVVKTLLPVRGTWVQSLTGWGTKVQQATQPKRKSVCSDSLIIFHPLKESLISLRTYLVSFCSSLACVLLWALGRICLKVHKS